ncbi:MAG: SDR family oxidoreductase [Desulfobacteraceae bacterium]|nr:SDR family oxidoreductase [Desulfobacteraceae bacterium]MBC2756394.1 SDR family oxidoreductase [Desulfobacteraceae bacterium]
MNKKTILITGAASGIGRETALFFAKKKWFVGIFDVNEDGLKSLSDEIGKENCFTQVMEVTDPQSVKTGIEAFAQQTGGKLNVLLNNAGILKFGRYEKVNLQDHLKIIDVNVKGCLNCIYHAFEYLKATPDARIINMSSTSSAYGIPELSVYSATKHALSAMTEALDIEFEKYGIIVCDIKPPYVKTPLLDNPKEVYSIKKLGINYGPERVAKTVWKSAHSRKLHRTFGVPQHCLYFLFWLMPFIRRFFIKTVTISGKAA